MPLTREAIEKIRDDNGSNRAKITKLIEAIDDLLTREYIKDVKLVFRLTDEFTRDDSWPYICGYVVTAFYEAKWQLKYNSDQRDGEWFDIRHLEDAPFHGQTEAYYNK